MTRKLQCQDTSPTIIHSTQWLLLITKSSFSLVLSSMPFIISLRIRSIFPVLMPTIEMMRRDVGLKIQPFCLRLFFSPTLKALHQVERLSGAARPILFLKPCLVIQPLTIQLLRVLSVVVESRWHHCLSRCCLCAMSKAF